MQGAPSVSYPVGRSAFCARLYGIAGLVALLAVGMLTMQARMWVTVIGALAWLLWGLLAWRAWRAQPTGRLCWEAAPRRHAPGDETTAGRWVWFSGAYREGVGLQGVQRVYDLQRRMLVRWHNPDGRVFWAWVEQAADPSRWDDLRRALRASA